MTISFEAFVALAEKVYSDAPLSAKERSAWEALKIQYPEIGDDTVDDNNLMKYTRYKTRVDQAWINHNKRHKLQHSEPAQPLNIQHPLNIPPQPAVRCINWRAIAYYAAAAVVLLTVSVAVYYYKGQPEKVKQHPGITATVTPFTMQTAPDNALQQLTLADGTKTFLFPRGSLRYPKRFDGKERVVAVTGEAYFEVAKDKQGKPFRVQFGDVEIEVLGTRFNVKEEAAGQRKRISLLEGSISLKRGREIRIVKPGEEIVITPKAMSSQAFDSVKVLAWKNEKFLFQRATLDDIIHQLEEWYHVTIQYKDLQGSERFSLPASYNRRSTLKEILEALRNTGAFSYQYKVIEGRPVITLNRNKHRYH